MSNAYLLSEHVFVLTTLIYRSQLNLSCRSAELQALVEQARTRNAGLNITGVLLSKGDDVLQLLEGSEESVVRLFQKIREDKRHSGVVELMRDYGPRRRFENVGMLLFDLQNQSPKDVLQSVLHYSKLDSYLTSDDRVFKFIQTFITGKRPALWRESGSAGQTNLPVRPPAHRRTAGRENQFA